MQRIIIPTHYVHTRSTPLWTKRTAPASIWKRHLDAGTRQGVFPPEKWHRIEALTEDTVFNVDFYVDPDILIEG